MKGVGWVLPVLTLVLCESAMYIRQIRTIVLQEMEQDYVEAARLRGISDVAHSVPQRVESHGAYHFGADGHDVCAAFRWQRHYRKRI